MNLKLKIWRQDDQSNSGQFRDYEIGQVSPDSSFLEMLDLLNEQLAKGEEPVAFDLTAAKVFAECVRSRSMEFMVVTVERPPVNCTCESSMTVTRSQLNLSALKLSRFSVTWLSTVALSIKLFKLRFYHLSDWKRP